jgi:hypothetical protein
MAPLDIYGLQSEQQPTSKLKFTIAALFIRQVIYLNAHWPKTGSRIIEKSPVRIEKPVLTCAIVSSEWPHIIKLDILYEYCIVEMHDVVNW